MRKLALAALALVVLSLVPATAWSNGGYSADANNPDYGTHDWLAHHALDWVPDNTDFWIRNNLAIYLYGTELPDNSKAVLGDGIGDTTLHHVYYRSNGQLQDDASARRAQEACDQVLSYLNTKDYAKAAKWMGVASHYVCDLAVFGHVMGSSTDWGSEKHHSDYEDWVTDRTNRYDTPFTAYLSLDGKLETILAYDAALRLARDTTFDGTGKGRTAKWMDDNYNPGSSSYQGRIGESLNLAVNLLADVIYSMSQTGQIATTTTTTTVPSTTTSPSATTTAITITSSPTSGTTVTTTTSYASTPSTVLTSTIIPSTTTTTTAQTSPTLTHSTSQTQSTTLVSTTTAQQRRCIIATAAYGSEMEPEVQLLRDLRDQKLLPTFAGSQFMQIFDRFYYSFSPQVAEVVGSNPAIAEMTRILIAPLISVLKIFTIIPGSEPWIVLTGTVTAAAVGLVYLTLPLSVIAFAKRGEDAKK